MEVLSRYILSVVCAAVLAGILCSLIPGTGGIQSLLRFLSGVYLIITMIQPLIRFDFTWLEDMVMPEASAWRNPAEEGEQIAREEVAERIQTELTAYILDKASDLGGELHVDIRFSDDPVPVPLEADLTGSISSHGKESLIQVLEYDLGIAKENQRWNTAG